MSTPFLDVDQDTIVKVLADVLTALCANNDKLPPPATANKFYAADVPGITIHDYLTRIKKYAQCSTQCFILALIYIDKLIQGPNFVICSLNVHRIVITTIMLAAKFFDDCYYNNRYYARIGGVEALEMNQLEVEFLFMTNFQLAVTPDVYQQYFSQLCTHISQQPGSAPNQFAHIVAHNLQQSQHLDDIGKLKDRLFDEDGNKRPFPLAETATETGEMDNAQEQTQGGSNQEQTQHSTEKHNHHQAQNQPEMGSHGQHHPGQSQSQSHTKSSSGMEERQDYPQNSRNPATARRHFDQANMGQEGYQYSPGQRDGRVGGANHHAETDPQTHQYANSRQSALDLDQTHHQYSSRHQSSAMDQD